MTPAPGTAVLEAKGLVAGYERGLPIVKGASIRLGDREIVTILGPNGAGKSTLIKAIAGLVPISDGTVSLFGQRIDGVPAQLMVRRGLAFVPQTENVFARLTVQENLDLAAGAVPRARRAERIAAQYALFPDLARARREAAGRLSGGQRQMVAVARALIPDPKVVMLDEPSAGLSPKLVGVVFEMLRRVRDLGVAVLLVEQNARAALAISDRAYVLVDGRERLERPAAGLMDAPEVRALYLGHGAAAGVA